MSVSVSSILLLASFGCIVILLAVIGYLWSQQKSMKSEVNNLKTEVNNLSQELAQQKRQFELSRPMTDGPYSALNLVNRSNR